MHYIYIIKSVHHTDKYYAGYTLDVPTRICLWRVIKRAICNWGKVIPGNPEGCKQEIFTRKFLEFLKWIWGFNKNYRSNIMAILDQIKDRKRVYVVQTTQEIEKLVNKT